MKKLLLILFVLMTSSPSWADDFGKRDKNQHDMITSLKAYAVYKMGQYDEAYDLWLPLAENGHTTSMINIASMYMQGQGRPVDLAKARYWIEKAHELGDERAVDMLIELK
ncbi:hypothetical protein RYZ26_06940 [Terasakiella sp. A23]|uniref:tetratricopeptide repeat protein n=1 Tax=Terasakiella sp. FCG-A23 TaxID=3080561 RepID=UPI002954F7D0|nr:hypothetical protein [Terasakiella sp. A23]MDV7339321.1 hypothetical protein [Terasakiella sp. A23]